MFVNRFLVSVLIIHAICIVISEALPAKSTCGRENKRVRFDEEKELLSPDVPQKRGFCRWKLNTRRGLHLQLTFSTLSIDASLGYFKIYDASSPDFTWAEDDIIQTLQGTKAPGFSALFPTNVIGIKYSSPANASTFALTYKSVIPEGGDCGHNIEAGFGVQSITSPGWPKKNYPNGLKCNWVIKGKEGTRLNLHIKRMKTNSSSDFLQIYDGDKLVSQEHGVISNKKPFLVSSAGQFRLYFETDGEGTDRGFRVRYSSVPHFNVTKPGPVEKTIKCFNILSTKTGGSTVLNQKSETDCPPGNQCINVKSEAIQRILGLEVKSTTNFGGCALAGSCGRSYCDQLSKVVPGIEISSCKTKCCDTDLCNDVATEEETPPPTEMECYNGMITSLSTGTVVVDTVNSTNCAEGSSCLRASITYKTYGITVGTVFGDCIPKISCSSVNCETVKKFLPSASSLDVDECDITCCDSDLCNNLKE